MFGTLYFFTLLGLVMKLVGDLTYTLVDPRIDFEARRRLMTPARCLGSVAARRGAGSPTSAPTGAASGRCGSSSRCSCVSLFAEFIANDRPLLVRYDGALLLPGVRATIPETTFGGDLRDRGRLHATPRSQQLIDAKGWMVWPPIPYSYDTVVCDLPAAGAVAADAAATGSAPTTRRATCWPALIYGFRISVLFGLDADHRSSSIVGVAAGAVQGYFGGWIDLAVPALHRDLVEHADALPADHPGQHRRARASGGCSASCCCSAGWRWSGVVRAEFLRARNFDYVRAARALGVLRRAHHVPPRPAQRHGRDAHLPAVHPGRLRHHADRRSTSSASACRRARRRSASCCRRARTTCRRRGSASPASSSSALMLSLLVFIGEAVRDAFDPRKVPA